MTLKYNNDTDKIDVGSLIPVFLGDTILVGDVFRNVEGTYEEMDQAGRLFGITCVGQVVRKEGCWFRNLKQVY